MSISFLNSPLLLGFEDFERVIERANKAYGENYPPYNIEQLQDNGFRISIAVAGFYKKELKVYLENNQLIIKGKKNEEGIIKNYLHRGIATRQFIRTFVIAEGIKICGAKLDHGILYIDLIRPYNAANVINIEIEDIQDDIPENQITPLQIN